MIRTFIKRLLGREQTQPPPPAADYPFKYRPPANSPSSPAPATAEPVAAEAGQEVEEAPAAPAESAPTPADPVAAETSAPEPAVEETLAAAEPEPVSEPAAEPVDYNTWTVKALRAELAELGVELKARMKKAELVALMEAQSAPAEEEADADGPGANPGGLDPVVVQELLDDMVRPALQADGGDITLIKCDGMDVHVKLVGACSTCPSSIMTMKMGVEALFREEFEGFGDLIQVE